ncbi:MAG: ATP synthase F1 subunit gamma [Candidatus Moraniibacteriota bacterium]
MANSTKEIQRRIKSVKNTRKITRAMEMVSAAKMRKEVERVLAIRSYAHSAWNVLTNLSKSLRRYQHGLLEAREVERVLVVLVTSNRGLCGSYNSQLINKVMNQVKNPGLIKINRVAGRRISSQVADEDVQFDFVAVGKKGFNYLTARNYNVNALFEDFNYSPSLYDVRSLAKMVMDDYSERKYDKVVLAYTDYINTMNQQPRLRQLLPISQIDLEKQIEEMSSTENGPKKEQEEEDSPIGYKIEPSPEQVVEHILPRLVEMQLYHAILESNASKESARMMAMKNASDAASDMTEQLQYSYNQLRQAAITQEITEITTGKLALED